MMLWILGFSCGFFLMEYAAWAAHRYLMHGPLWFLHQDHHTPGVHFFQRNDWFFLIFAVPSMLSIMFGLTFNWLFLSGFGFGIMGYGLTYILVHELLIHRRFKILPLPRRGYFAKVVKQHQIHHQSRFKEGGKNFGMLWVNPRDWTT